MNLSDQLRAPFNPAAIHWRIQTLSGDKSRGLALAYIDARDVMKRLDDVVGPEGWQDRYTESAKGRVICELSININGEWITKSDGAGDTAVEGEKGGISDAFKRAAVKWGIGRYLYQLGNTWVAVKPRGRTHEIAENPQLPEWATPDGYWSRIKKQQEKEA